MRTARISVVILAAGLALTACGRSAKRENVMLKDENSKLQANLDEVSSQNQSYETSLSQANAKIQQANAKIKELATQSDQFKRSLSAAQAKYAETTKRYQAKVDDDAKQMASMQQQMANFRANFEKCQNDVATANAANDKANAQIAELAKQVAALSSRPEPSVKSAPAAAMPPRNQGRTQAGVNER